jgi:hypothetical protein
MQILLARFQIQEGVITRASDRLNDARQKVSDTHVHQKELALELKRLEDELNTAENPQQQNDLQDRIKHVKSDLEVTGSLSQQQQATEIQAQQQLREEQDKLNALESQLDELVRSIGNSSENQARIVTERQHQVSGIIASCSPGRLRPGLRNEGGGKRQSSPRPWHACFARGSDEGVRPYTSCDPAHTHFPSPLIRAILSLCNSVDAAPLWLLRSIKTAPSTTPPCAIWSRGK